MRVSGHNVKVNNISNTYKTCRVLNFMLSVFGLNCNVHRNAKLMLIRIFLSIIILGALLVFVIYYKANHINKVLNKSVTATDTAQNIYDYFQYIIDLFYVYKYGGHVYCEYFKQYSTIDDIIGREKDINLIKNRLSKLSVIFITIWLLNSICDFVAWSLTFGWKTPLIYSPSYLYLLIRMVTNLDTICQILNIQCRMRVIYNIVHDSYESADSLSVTICDTIQNKNWFYNRKTPDSTHKKITPQEYNRDKQLSKCYLLLTEQCAYINQMFGFRVSFRNLACL
ncbi:unnamed protein product [Diatraea saccharalis]|uniref:Gustatory receptor n=1 Tax=Diatraea saccharalis TaxID=40085 RepID=A0A9N9QZL1_9NEOP|nr:unnamed protein product [Diatraea saccharalis]